MRYENPRPVPHRIVFAIALVTFAAACSEDVRQLDLPLQGTDAGSDVTPDGTVESPDLPTEWTVLVSPDAPEAVELAARDVADYLTQMGLPAAMTESMGEVTCQPNLGVVALQGDGLGEEALQTEEQTDQTWRMRETRCDGGILVGLSGGGLLGRQYAAYEWLHVLGVRYFHPEQEYVPGRPTWPAEPVDRQHTPAFRYRSVSLHLTHPLELGDAFRLNDETRFDEAVRYIDWQIKNGASYGTEGVGTGDLADYGRRRGLPRSAGFSLNSQQQGGEGIIDPDDPRSEEEQIAEAIEARLAPMERPPDFFTFSFNPTEFTETDDRDAVRQMTFIAEYMAEHYPTVQLQTTNHGTFGPPTDFYGVRYYDLPRFAPPNLGVKVHPLMFYDLFRPAPVYGNASFDFLFDFMVSEYRTRELWYFPESAWWLTFDLPVPLYLPITLDARDRDIQGIAFMLDGGLDGHRVFGSGHEWGYWQNEYCPFRMAADLDFRLTDCLADLTSPMGSAAAQVQAVLEEVIRLQERDIIYGDILAYLVGTDPETEVAAAVGIVFHPLPPAPQAIMSWDLEQVDEWQRRIAPALERMAADYSRLVERLEAVGVQVPENGLAWFEEIRDGVEITGLRARHAGEVYGAAVTLREARLRFDADLEVDAQALMAAALETTQAALDVIHRREASYRYHPLSRSIAGGPDGDQDENWTIYPYRYLNRTHHAYYWTRIDGLVEAVLAGGDAAVEVADALLGADEALVVDVLDNALTEVAVDLGDGTVEPSAHVEHTYAEAGVFSLTVTAVRDGAPFEFTGRVAQLATEYATGFSGVVVEPPGADLIENVLPGLVFGPIGNGRGALGFDTDDTGRVGLGLWSELDVVSTESVFESLPLRVVVPVINRSTGVVLASIVVENARLVLAGPGDVVLTGELATQAVVDAIVAIGGFESDGARALVASTLGYTPDTLPAHVSFQVDYSLR